MTKKYVKSLSLQLLRNDTPLKRANDGKALFNFIYFFNWRPHNITNYLNLS